MFEIASPHIFHSDDTTHTHTHTWPQEGTFNPHPSFMPELNAKVSGHLVCYVLFCFLEGRVKPMNSFDCLCVCVCVCVCCAVLCLVYSTQLKDVQDIRREITAGTAYREFKALDDEVLCFPLWIVSIFFWRLVFLLSEFSESPQVRVTIDMIENLRKLRAKEEDINKIRALRRLIEQYNKEILLHKEVCLFYYYFVIHFQKKWARLFLFNAILCVTETELQCLCGVWKRGKKKTETKVEPNRFALVSSIAFWTFPTDISTRMRSARAVSSNYSSSSNINKCMET